MADDSNADPNKGGEDPSKADPNKGGDDPSKDDPNKGGSSNNTPDEAAIRAQVAREFADRLKGITGADSLDALEAQTKTAADEQLKKQGEFEKLANAKAAEALELKAKWHATLTSNALLSAASAADAVNATVVSELLAPKAQVDDAGNVTIDGKSPAGAVEALLKEHPYLKKAAGGGGSGAGAGGGGAAQADYQEAKKAGNLTGMLKAKREKQ
ncbi:hypothetical protein [Endothiovibrio diazotrophicus]